MNIDQAGRFKDAPWFSLGVDVLIGGAGGIGSWVSLLLSRAGFTPVIYDFDSYEMHNMAGQLCRKKDVGLSKVGALANTILEFSDTVCHTFNEKYDENSMTGKFVFAGFDNMEARRMMFLNWKKLYGDNKEAVFIDGRLLAEQIQIYCVVGGTDRVRKYEETALFLDSEVEEAPCTMKQTSHIAAMIASFMTAFFTNHLTNVLKGQSRNIPYFWEYFSPIGYLNIEED